MQFLTILVVVLLGGCALIFVLYPLYQHISVKPQRMAVATNPQAEREQTARTALQEVELDFQLGNLAEPDYRSLRERYMRRALLAMKSRHDREQELDAAIEEQLRHMRETDEANRSVERSEHELS
jgi:hypothetical protein